VWANPKLDLGDVVLEVDGVNNGGTEDNSFGVICRQDSRSTQPAYYFFIISSDGYYGIGKAKDGQSRLLSSRDMQFSEAIRQGDAANRLRAECQDSQLTLWANEVQLAQVNDADFTHGDVGLIAQSFEAGAVDVLFDNFRVTQP
jgi:hypothetical protein